MQIPDPEFGRPAINEGSRSAVVQFNKQREPERLEKHELHFLTSLRARPGDRFMQDMHKVLSLKRTLVSDCAQHQRVIFSY